MGSRALSQAEIDKLLLACEKTRYVPRNKAVVGLAFYAGLTPREISCLKRYMVFHSPKDWSDFKLNGTVKRQLSIPEGMTQNVSQRIIDLNEDIREYIYGIFRSVAVEDHDPLILSERSMAEDRYVKNFKLEENRVSIGKRESETATPVEAEPMNEKSVAYLLFKLYKKVGITGASGMSGRATFIKGLVNEISDKGVGSLQDVRYLSGCTSLEAAERWAKRFKDEPIPKQSDDMPLKVRQIELF